MPTSSRPLDAPAPVPVPVKPVDLDTKTKKIVVQVIKAGLKRMADRQMLPERLDYQDLISDRHELAEALRVYRRNRAAFDDILVSAKGEPIRDDRGRTLCGPAVGQVVQMLIWTCAKKMASSLKGDMGVAPARKPKAEPKSTLGGLFGARKEPDEVVDPKAAQLDQRLNGLQPYLAYDWQLPLLDIYLTDLTRMHVQVLDKDLLKLQDRDALMAIVAIQPGALRVAKENLGPQFTKAVTDYRDSLPGIAEFSEKEVVFLREHLGNRFWRFFARDWNYRAEVRARGIEMVEIIGPVLAELCLESLDLLDGMELAFRRMFIEVFLDELDEDSWVVMGDPIFAKTVLREMLDSLTYATLSDDQFRAAARLKAEANKAVIERWMVQGPPKEMLTQDSMRAG